MKKRKGRNGFTLIEIAVTVMIIAIMAGLAIGSIVRSQPRFRIRGDSWALYQGLTKAKFLTIDGNRPHGLMCYHTGNAQLDYFFIFMDWNNNGLYDDTDGNPLVQCDPRVTSGCLEDPIIGGLTPLHSSNIFVSAFGTDLTTIGAKEFVTFNSLGSVVQLGARSSSDIVIQNKIMFDLTRRLSYSGGDRVDFASGTASRLPTVPAALPTYQ